MSWNIVLNSTRKASLHEWCCYGQHRCQFNPTTCGVAEYVDNDDCNAPSSFICYKRGVFDRNGNYLRPVSDADLHGDHYDDPGDDLPPAPFDHCSQCWNRAAAGFDTPQCSNCIAEHL